MLILILALALMPMMLNADMFEPSHSCSKPYKPYEFTDQYQVDSYNDEVQTFKNCIQEFVDEQNDAMKKHSDAADSAIEDWNSFARYN